MAKKADTPDPMDRKIRHPEPDASANAGADGGPPSTWDPGKVTQHVVAAELHTFTMAADEDGQTRWECSCGKAGRWGKSADREFFGGWQQHIADVEEQERQEEE